MDFSFAACRNPAWRAASGGEPEKRSRLCFIGFFCWVMDLKSDLPGMAGRPFPAEERMRRAHDGPAPEYAPPSGSAMIIISGVDRASDVWKTRVGLPVLRTISRGGNSPPPRKAGKLFAHAGRVCSVRGGRGRSRSAGNEVVSEQRFLIRSVRLSHKFHHNISFHDGY